MEKVVVKTIFLSSSDDERLENFIIELLAICKKYQLSFSEINALFEKIIFLAKDSDFELPD